MQAYTEEERSLKYRVTRFSWNKILLAGLFAAFLFTWSIGFTEKLVDLYQVTFNIEEIQGREQALQTEIVQLQQEKDDLEEDWYIEMQARERLNLVKPGEVVIKLIEPE